MGVGFGFGFGFGAGSGLGSAKPNSDLAEQHDGGEGGGGEDVRVRVRVRVRVTWPSRTMVVRAEAGKTCSRKAIVAPEWSKAVKSAASEAASSNTRGSDWAPSGPVSAVGALGQPELPGAH